MIFEANQGQTDSHVQFLARGSKYTVFLSPDQMTLSFARGDGNSSSLEDAAVLRLSLEGTSQPSLMKGQDPLASRSHYFYGSDPRLWKTGIPSYSKVICPQVYPGIDLVYYGNEGRLEYDLRVAPGADPRAIRLRFHGMEQVRLDAEGNLILQTPAGAFTQHRPLAWQEMDGRRRDVHASFKIVEHTQLSASALVQIELGPIDPHHTLVIDPVLSFATLFGGKRDDQAYGISLDSEGNIYVAGQTSSPDFPRTADTSPETPGGYDAFVTKFKANTYEIVYSAFFGGSANDRVFHVAVDGKGQALVSGVTYSTNFPVFSAAQPRFGGGERDGFVAKLLADGSGFVYASYWGGNHQDDATCIATDPEGNAYVAGDSFSTNFPTVKPIQAQNRGGFDAVVGMFDPQGKLVFSSYLGGSGPYDSAIGIAIDSSGNALLTGYTSSPDFPKANPLQASYRGGYEAFISKLNPARSEMIFSTFLGGSADDVGRGIAVDSAGGVYISGDTFSTNFPTRNPIQPRNAGKRDIFVTKLDPQGSKVIYSTYLGGSGEELGGITVDSKSNVCLVGVTSSPNFPLANPLQSSFGGGMWDAFVAKLNPSGSEWLFSSYLGGNGNDQGSPITVDKAGNMYIAGATTSTNFPLKNASQQINKGGPYDAFLLVISESGLPDALVQSTTPKTQPEVEQPDQVKQERLAQEKLAREKDAQEKLTQERQAHEKLAQERLEQERRAQEKLAQEKRAQEKLIQERLEQERRAQEKLAQEKLDQQESKPVISEQKLPAEKTDVPASEIKEPVSIPLFATNLVVNGDAEMGAASASSYGRVEIPGWTNIQGTLVLRYGTPGGFPTTNSPGPSERGDNFFVGGPNSALSSMDQIIDLASISEAIDRGLVDCQIFGYLGGAGGQRDTANLQIAFLSEQNEKIGEAVIGSANTTERSVRTGMILRQARQQVPKGTRSVKITLQMNRTDGSYNDAFADNIEFALIPRP